LRGEREAASTAKMGKARAAMRRNEVGRARSGPVAAGGALAVVSSRHQEPIQNIRAMTIPKKTQPYRR